MIKDTDDNKKTSQQESTNSDNDEGEEKNKTASDTNSNPEDSDSESETEKVKKEKASKRAAQDENVSSPLPEIKLDRSVCWYAYFYFFYSSK